jgi:hypothetical protein
MPHAKTPLPLDTPEKITQAIGDLQSRLDTLAAQHQADAAAVPPAAWKDIGADIDQLCAAIKNLPGAEAQHYLPDLGAMIGILDQMIDAQA